MSYRYMKCDSSLGILQDPVIPYRGVRCDKNSLTEIPKFQFWSLGFTVPLDLSTVEIWPTFFSSKLFLNVLALIPFLNYSI